MKLSHLILVPLLLQAALADVRLPAIFSDHMVLERGDRVPVWGSADPNESIAIDIAGQRQTGRADEKGWWRIDLDLSKAGHGPYELLVEGKSRRVISDVLIGEVWLASGQSNMTFPLEADADAATAIAESANPQIRMFAVEKAFGENPLDEVSGTWVVSSPETSGKFSAVAYYFARRVQGQLGVPVGVIHASWGGSNAEAWLSGEALDSDENLKLSSMKYREKFAQRKQESKKFAAAMEQWMRESGRPEQPTSEPDRFAGDEISGEGWVSFQVPPGGLLGEIPANGVIWFRREVDLPPDLLKQNFRVDFKDTGGVETVYWNGSEVLNVSYAEHPGKDVPRRAYIPMHKLRSGKNILAIRVFAPGRPATLPGISGESLPLDGRWQAKTETILPSLDPASLASIPQPPGPSMSPKGMPGYLFNGMIRPLIPYALTGAIWYQGESNAKRAAQYRTTLPLLIRDWRARWGQGDFPFIICQLANHLEKKDAPQESAWSELRGAQADAAKLPNCDLAVLIDQGEANDIHPRNKKIAGDRVAAIALARNYGADLPFSGPVYRSMRVEGDKIRLSFDHAAGGLVAAEIPATHILKSIINQTAPLARHSPASELEGFQICGQDRRWVWADARIDGNGVLVWSPDVPQPSAVRYAWADNPTCNLFNSAGLPAGPFRTDSFPLSTKDVKY